MGATGGGAVGADAVRKGWPLELRTVGNGGGRRLGPRGSQRWLVHSSGKAERVGDRCGTRRLQICGVGSRAAALSRPLECLTDCPWTPTLEVHGVVFR